MFLYDLGSSSCSESSCPGVFPEAMCYFNPNGPYAQITLSKPSFMLGFFETVSAYGYVSADSFSTVSVYAEWIVTYCAGWQCSSKTYKMQFIYDTGAPLGQINKLYYPQVIMYYPPTGSYSLDGGNHIKMSASPTGPGAQSEAVADFYNPPPGGGFPYNLDVSSISISTP
jgi:hypothetical protein